MESTAYSLASLGVGIVTVTVSMQVGHATLSVVTATSMPVVVTSINTAKSLTQDNETLTALDDIKSTAIANMKHGLSYGAQSINIFLSIIPVVAILSALVIIIALLVGAIQGFQPVRATV